MTKTPFDLVVVGDELEGCVTALSAAMAGVKNVCLVRPTRDPWLGGLSTRGGLSYMDLTLECMPPLLLWLLRQTPWKRVALVPEVVSEVLSELLERYGVTVRVVEPSGVPDWLAERDVISGRLTAVSMLTTSGQVERVEGAHWVDATPDGALAVALGARTIPGLGGLFGNATARQLMGVSPVFEIVGCTAAQLMAGEHRVREVALAEGWLRQALAEALPHHPETFRIELETRPCFCPSESDYLDILNPTLGVLWHLWKQDKGLIPPEQPYDQARAWVDGGNVSRLGPERLGFNGLVTRLASLADQVATSQERLAPPDDLVQELGWFEAYLREVTGVSRLRVVAPRQLYVRNSWLIPSKNTRTGAWLSDGGVPETDAIGWFSYWLDFRGVNLWEVAPEVMPFPKPAFRVNLAHCELCPTLPGNVYGVSRAIGVSPLAQSACRIVQHQCLVGEGLGIAVAEAHHAGTHKPLQVPPWRVREVLADRLSVWGLAEQTEVLVLNHKALLPPHEWRSRGEVETLLRRDEEITTVTLS